MTMHRWLCEPLPKDVAGALARLATAPGVQHIAVMPDVHLSEHVCVGTVLGTTDWIYPQAVGGDIGCGMAAAPIHGDATALDAAAAERLWQALREAVPPVRRPKPLDADLPELADRELSRRLQRDLAVELGTLGRGNHFLELQCDEHGGLWLAVHSGSRALGPALRDHHLARGEAKGKGLIALAAAGPGREYLSDVAIAESFARQNRRAIGAAAAGVLAAELGWQVDFGGWFESSHNHVRAECHDGRELWVHRKGASPAGAGQQAIVPGSMGTATFHVEGRGVAAALASCAHGAGRALARGEAARAITVRDLERSMAGVWYDRQLAPRLRDEAPAAYKDIGAVMRAQRELVRIVRRLRPLLAYKAC